MRVGLWYNGRMKLIPQTPGVYRIYCSKSKKCYIGSTTNLRKRWYWHRGDLRQNRHHNRHLQFAWNKYGADSFSFEILETVEDVETLCDREQYWIDRYKSCDHSSGYNFGKSARAPFLGIKLSDEHKEKIRATNKKREVSPATRIAAAKWHGSKEGLEWHSELGKRSWENRKPIKKKCELCGKEYNTLIHGSGSRFCSARCKDKYHSIIGRKKKKLTCEYCGVKYESEERTRFCSKSCSAKSRARDILGRLI